jgi:hypothetical protein
VAAVLLLPREHGRQMPEFRLYFRGIRDRVRDFLAKKGHGTACEVARQTFDRKGNTNAAATVSSNGNISTVTFSGMYKVNSPLSKTSGIAFFRQLSSARAFPMEAGDDTCSISKTAASRLLVGGSGK